MLITSLDFRELDTDGLALQTDAGLGELCRRVREEMIRRFDEQDPRMLWSWVVVPHHRDGLRVVEWPMPLCECEAEEAAVKRAWMAALRSCAKTFDAPAAMLGMECWRAGRSYPNGEKCPYECLGDDPEATSELLLLVERRGKPLESWRSAIDTDRHAAGPWHREHGVEVEGNLVGILPQ